MRIRSWMFLSSAAVFLVSKRTSIFPARFAVGSTEICKRDGAHRHSLRAFVHHRDGVEFRVLADGKDLQARDGDDVESQVLADGKDSQCSNDGDGEVMLSQGKVFARRMALGRLRTSKAERSSFARPGASWATNLLSRAGDIENEEPATQTRPLLKVVQSESGTCLELHPGVLKGRKAMEKPDQALLQKVKFLHSESAPLSQLLKRTAVINASLENLEMVVHVLTEFCESKSIAFHVLMVSASILERPVENLKHRLCILEEFEVDRETCIKVALSPVMWTVKLKTFEDVLKFLQGLGLDAQARSNMIRRYPMLLHRKASSMRVTVSFFESIGFSGPKFLKLLVSRPSLLGLSVDKNLMVKFKLLQDRGFSVKEFVRAIYFVSHMSNEQIIMRFDLLKDQGLPPEHINKIVRLKPSILASSLQGLKAKVEFLVHTLRRDINELRAFPNYLACSLEHRIVPRFRALEAVGLCKLPALSTILRCKTPVFREMFNIPDSVVC